MLGRPPDTSTSARAPPPPLGPLGPPRARGVTAPLLSFLRSAPCQEEGALLRPKGQGPRPSAGGARVRGDPRQRRGPGGAERRREVARTVCGRGGEPHSGSRRLLPAPASTFCTAQRGTCLQPLGLLPWTPQGTTRRGVGGRLPKAARPSRRGSKLSGAASPTAIFPGKRPSRRLRRRFPHLLLPLLRDLPLPLRSSHR